MTVTENTTYYQQAKKDYASGLYTWHCLQKKYPSLSVKDIFQIIFEVKNKDYT